jgi:hypothetical protein
MRFALSAFLFLTAGLAWVSAYALPGSQVFEDIQVSSGSGESEIGIHLTVPANIIRFSPQKASDTLQVQLASPSSAVIASGFRESLPWKPSTELPLVEVVYEQAGNASSRLTLRFRREFEFSVEPGGDSRSLIVSVRDPEFRGGASSPVSRDKNGSSANGSSSSSPAELTSLERAQDAVIKEDWSAVIAYYGKVLQDPLASAQHPEAHEMLGVARERMGQAFRARQEYENYLKLYPKGEGAARVRQRLAGLDSAGSKEKAKLGRDRKGEAGDRSTAPISELYGGFSQYYFQGGRFSDAKGVTRDTSLLLNNLYVNGRLRTERYDFRGRFDARYRENFMDEANRQFRISNFYIDAQDRVAGLMTRLGRQTRSTGGVLGRFDGGVIGYRFAPKWQAVAVGGFPVQPFLSTSVDTTNSFYGFSLEAGPFYDVWAGNIYFINQDARRLSVPDRRAIGGELRYQDPIHPVFTQIDYDIFVNELNIAQMQGSWNFEGGAILQANFDYRRVPIASTSGTWDLLRYGTPLSINDALFQQVISDAVIQEAARLNSSVMKTFTVGGIFPITKKFQFNADIMVSDLSEAANLAKFVNDVIKPQFGTLVDTTLLGYPYEAYFNGVGIQGSGLQMSYTAQLIGNSLLRENDIWTLGLRYTDNDAMQDILSMYMDSHYPVTSDIRLAPRMRVDYYNGGRNGIGSSDFVRVRPAMRLNYRVVKALNLELEGGFEWNNNRDRDSADSKSYYFSAGYRLDF